MIGEYREKDDEDFRITIELSDKPEKGDCLVTVTRKNADGAETRWVFYGSFDADGRLRYTECVKTDEAADEPVYTDGSGTLTYDREKQRLTWQDDREDAAKDLIFVKK